MKAKLFIDLVALLDFLEALLDGGAIFDPLDELCSGVCDGFFGGTLEGAGSWTAAALAEGAARTDIGTTASEAECVRHVVCVYECVELLRRGSETMFLATTVEVATIVRLVRYWIRLGWIQRRADTPKERPGRCRLLYGYKAGQNDAFVDEMLPRAMLVEPEYVGLVRVPVALAIALQKIAMMWIDAEPEKGER